MHRNVGALLTRDVTQEYIPKFLNGCQEELGYRPGNSSCLFELPSAFPREGGIVSATLSFLAIFVQTTSNRDLKDCFLHLRFELNSAIKQDEASLVHIARRNALSWDSFTTSRVGKTNLYQNLHVHGLWTRQHKISIPFTWSKVIPNSENQNGIGRFPDLSSPLAEWKVWLARLGGNHVALVWGWKDTPLDLSFYLWGSLAFASQIF